MQYSQIEASIRWKKYVECFWFLSAEPDEESLQPIVPDGRMELVFHLGDPFIRQCADGTSEVQARWLIIGQMREPVFVRPTGVTNVVGIHFKPAGAMPFLGAQQHKWSGRIVEFSPSRQTRQSLEQKLSTSTSNEEICEALEFLLQSIFSLEWEPSASVQEILNSLSRKETLSLTQIFKNARISPRHAQRLFSGEVGLTPKEFQRIQRFQWVFQCYQKQEDWIATALECGYYDQSHLIRDFKSLAGLSPTEFENVKHSISDSLQLHRRIRMS